MAYEKGDWRVMRNCCTSGMCFHCRGKFKRPMVIIQGDNYSEKYAKNVARNWETYKAWAERMPEEK